MKKTHTWFAFGHHNLASVFVLWCDKRKLQNYFIYKGKLVVQLNDCLFKLRQDSKRRPTKWGKAQKRKKNCKRKLEHFYNYNYAVIQKREQRPEEQRVRGRAREREYWAHSLCTHSISFVYYISVCLSKRTKLIKTFLTCSRLCWMADV